MSHQVAVFRFTLGIGQSIGPVALREIWIRACQSTDVTVGRSGRGYDDRPTYTLFAPTSLADLPKVEQRVRELLDVRGLRASLIPMKP